MSLPKPTWEPIWLLCGECKHRWDDWQPGHVPISTWIAHVRTYRCPSCGSEKVMIRITPMDDRA